MLSAVRVNVQRVSDSGISIAQWLKAAAQTGTDSVNQNAMADVKKLQH